MQNKEPRNPQNPGNLRNARDTELGKAAELTQRALESAGKLGLSPADAALVLGVPSGVYQAMKKGTRTVDGYNGEAERADALVRITSRLSALLGAEETHWRSWIRRSLPQWGQAPLVRMLQRDGVQHVAAFLESVDRGSFQE